MHKFVVTISTCFLGAMVLLEHVGYGGRDRQVFMYYWDLRDGPEFAGWWVTPDYIGNHEFFLNCSGTEAATPSDCACGAWRSPNVEELQVRDQRTAPTMNASAAHLVRRSACSVLSSRGFLTLDLRRTLQPTGSLRWAKTQARRSYRTISAASTFRGWCGNRAA